MLCELRGEPLHCIDMVHRRQSAPPKFELVAASGINLSTRERELEERHPTPMTIRTHFLSPRNVKMVWVRHPKDVAHFDPMLSFE